MRLTRRPSVTICSFTTLAAGAPLVRLAIAPSERDGFVPESHLMVDTITTVSKGKLGKHVLSDQDVVRLTRAVLVFLGLVRSGNK